MEIAEKLNQRIINIKKDKGIIMEVRITNDLTDIFRNIENAASKCYSNSTETFKILQKCINSGHDSV